MSQKTVVAMTKVAVKPGAMDEVAELFQQTNNALVAGQKDWLGTRLLADRSTNTIIVLATWKSAASHELFRLSKGYKSVMDRFAPLFENKPEVSVLDTVVDAAHDRPKLVPHMSVGG